MANLHGWINGITDVHSIQESLNILDKECAVKSYFTGMNGENCIFFFYDRNHYGICFDRIIELFTSISKNENSYGIIYIQDDESKYHNEFQVYVARKGIVYKEKDVYLSPCDKMIWN